MLSDEEKKAIERFKNVIYTYQDVIEDEYSDYEEKESAKEYQEVSEKILNLIEKQSKEIEELKDTNKKLYEMGKQNAIQELINNDYVSKDKIKEKIEEIENTGIDVAWEQVNYINRERDRAKIEVLQSLLEKKLPTTITKEELEKRWKE